MTFLQPLLLFAALGAAVPLWLHLRARTGQVRSFAAVRFLDDQPRPRREGVRPRDLLLLFARLAGLLLVVAAFAGPYRRDARPPRITESRVHVLDNTLSQQSGRAFEADRDRVAGLLRTSGSEVMSAVIELTGRPRVVAAFSDDPAEAERRVRALTPSHQRGSYLEALRLAQSLLSRSLGQRKRIVVHADQQENQWTENESAPPFLEDVEVELARRPTRPEQPNLGVSAPLARLFFVGERTFVDFSARLSHGGGAVPVRATAVLEVGGRVVTRERLTLRKAGEVVTLRAQWETDPAAWTVGQVRVETAEDALTPDDRVFFCLPPVREGRIALLARSPYLRAALAPETMKGRWSAQVLEPGPALAQTAETELADVLVVEADYGQSQPVRDLVFRYLNNERGVVVCVERTTPLVERFLAQLGFEPRGAPAAAQKGQGFRYVAAGHPIFKPFVAGDLGDLTQVRVFRHVNLQAREAVPLLYGDSGDPLLFEGTATKGRLLVFSFGLRRTHTDWPLLPSFLPFLDLSLQHARAAAPLQTAALPGAPYVHALPPGHTARELVVRGAGREWTRVPVDAERKARVVLPDPPGLYTLGYDDDDAVQAMVAVNTPAPESALRYVAEPPALKAWTLAARPAAPVAARAVQASRSALEQRLWWWVLLAAAGALALETTMLLVRRTAT